MQDVKISPHDPCNLCNPWLHQLPPGRVYITRNKVRMHQPGTLSLFFLSINLNLRILESSLLRLSFYNVTVERDTLPVGTVNSQRSAAIFKNREVKCLYIPGIFWSDREIPALLFPFF